MVEAEHKPDEAREIHAAPDKPAKGEPRAPDRDAQGLTDVDRRRRRSRSIALAVTLGLLVALFYVVTIAKLGPGVLDRPM